MHHTSFTQNIHGHYDFIVHHNHETSKCGYKKAERQNFAGMVIEILAMLYIFCKPWMVIKMLVMPYAFSNACLFWYQELNNILPVYLTIHFPTKFLRPRPQVWFICYLVWASTNVSFFPTCRQGEFSIKIFLFCILVNLCTCHKIKESLLTKHCFFIYIYIV